MPRQIKPYRQGDLDGLCGLHAIINALYLLFPDMSKEQAHRLYRMLTKEIVRVGGLKVIWRGIDPKLLRRLLPVAVASVTQQKRSAPVEVSRPFATGAIGLPDLVQTLRAKLGQGCLAIALVHDGNWHWTVIEKVTSKTIILFDSANLGAIRIENCTLEKSNKRYRLNAGHIVFLRRVQETKAKEKKQ